MKNSQDKKDKERELLLGGISALILALLFSRYGWDQIGLVGMTAVLCRLAYVYSEIKSYI